MIYRVWILFNISADHSLEAQDIISKMEQFMPTLEAILSEVDQFVESNKTYADDPHIIDVIMPMLCSYLPFWWSQGPDNVSPTGGLVTRMTADWFNRRVSKQVSRVYGDVRTHEPTP